MNFYEQKLLSKNISVYLNFLDVILIDIFSIKEDHLYSSNIKRVSVYLNSKHNNRLSNDGLSFTRTELLIAFNSYNIFDYCNVRSLNLLELILKSLIESNILHYSVFQKDVYCVTNDLVKYLGTTKRVAGYTLGFSKISEFNKNSIFAIEVMDCNSDLGIGTGFLYGFTYDEKVYSLIITNKHVIEEEIQKIVNLTDNKIKHSKIISCKKNIDLACILIDSNQIYEQDIEPLDFFHDNIDNLDEVITLGYPDVPNSLNLVLLTHKGQINGIFKPSNSESEYYVLSAKTSPGNSGSPVINEMGKVVGIVTESGESIRISKENKENFERFFYAIPTKTIVDFINEEVIPVITQPQN
jgi:hypothetical protein